MPHQGTPVATWILMCLVLALIWIATILVLRTLTGGRAADQLADPLRPRAKPSGMNGKLKRDSLATPLPQANGIRIPGADGGLYSGTQTGEVNERA